VIILVELDHKAGKKLQEKSKVLKMDKAWMNRLQINQKGQIKKNRFNVQLILDHDENLKDIGRLNIFSGHNEIYKSPFWRRKDDDDVFWTDTDEAQLRVYIDSKYGISNNSAIEDCLSAVFYKNAYHPIRDYLKAQSWDREKRLDSFFIDFLGASYTNYTTTVTRKMLVAAVARVFEPGIKFDTALILIGAQGVGKSYVLSRLGGDWFNESLNSFNGDEALMKLRNSWIIELAELSALKSSEVEEVKGFISAKVDTYRPKYGRNILRYPRQCVFFGSTNNFEFLKDQTGNRRFFPLPVNKSKRNMNPFEKLTDEYINQVWAEAYYLYLNGEPLHITNETVAQEAKRLQEEHTTDGGLIGIVEEFIKKEHLDRVCARQIWHECLNNDKEPKRHDISDINDILRKIEGWEQLDSPRRFGRYGNQRGFQKRSIDIDL